MRLDDLLEREDMADHRLQEPLVEIPEDLLRGIGEIRLLPRSVPRLNPWIPLLALMSDGGKIGRIIENAAAAFNLFMAPFPVTDETPYSMYLPICASRCQLFLNTSPPTESITTPRRTRR